MVSTALKNRNIHARGLDGRHLSTTMESFSMSGWRGMSLEAEDTMILEINACEYVNYVEADTIVKSNAWCSNQALRPVWRESVMRGWGRGWGRGRVMYLMLREERGSWRIWLIPGFWLVIVSLGAERLWGELPEYGGKFPRFKQTSCGRVLMRRTGHG